MSLRAASISDNGLRWLCCKGYIEHAVEVTLAGTNRRSFEPSASLVFSERECFVLTDSGRAYVSEEVSIPDPLVLRNGHPAARRAVDDRPTASEIPTWDRVRQELRFAGVLVKQFKVPSPNQETILGVFEEEHWPPRIDDPLSPKLDQDPKRRLHDTINTLNRNQKNQLLRFSGDGSGQGVRWEPSDKEPV